MSTTITWEDICIRLALACLAGGLIGFNREGHGRPAGLRTTILVCVAAAAAMIEANLLLSTSGKASDGFAVLDPMRLPLGILTGVGFIGAGTILHRGSLVLGLTTAATLWFTTVLGICVGGGQLGLGIGLTGIALIVLWGLKRIEAKYERIRVGRLVVRCERQSLSQDELAAILNQGEVRLRRLGFSDDGLEREYRCEIEWRASNNDDRIPPVIEDLSAQRKISFHPTG